LARGGHVQEADLRAALERGKRTGAMLEVFSQEPLPQESPLWRHPRVAMTPHMAAVTRPAEARAALRRTSPQREKGEPVTGP
ncbi:NAD(P)-dependent oxidoreductase, partial [Salmonella enterica subsp. enterica serovar Infantis]